MIKIEVSIRVKPYHLDRFMDLVKSHRQATLREPGCISFVVSCDVFDTSFRLDEMWAGQTSIDAHRQTSHYAKWREEIKDIQEDPRLHVEWPIGRKEKLIIDANQIWKGTVVVANGCFDGLHPGHVFTLEWAKQQGDVLLVAINDDAGVRRLKGVGRPRFVLDERCRMIEALECVDFVLPFCEDTPINAVAPARPKILVKGNDYAGRESIVPRPEGCAVRIAPPSGFDLHSSDVIKNRRATSTADC